MITEPRDIYKPLSEKYNQPIDVIREVIRFFYMTGVKRSLEDVRSQEVYVSKLGSFKIKDYKLKYLIPKLESRLNDNERENLREYYHDFLEKLYRVQDELKEIKRLKQTFDELNRKDSRDIQEPATDMGRTEEQINQD